MPAKSRSLKSKSKCPKGKTRDRVTKRCRSKRSPGRRAHMRSPKSLKAHKRSLRLQREFLGYVKKGNKVANAMLNQQILQEKYKREALNRIGS